MPKISPSKILLFILIITTLLRLFRLGYPQTFMFDEVYHAFTATQYLKNSKEAWDPWATPPKGVAYEWTHPPMAKEVMALSMIITKSEQAWAYRLPAALLGVISILVVYKIALALFKNHQVARLSALIFSIDGLSFVQSRIGMNDIYMISFSLISLLMFIKNRFFLSALFFGLSIASKWAGIYLLAVYLPLLVISKQFRKIPYFFLLPPLVYLLSYLPYFLLGYNASQFLELQRQMWWYHTNLKATHDYSSPWWAWPLNLYPVWYFVDYSQGKIANIFLSGNPVVSWAGMAAILLSLIEAVKRRSQELMLILLGFFAFWLPWSLSPRIMFLYHFTPTMPFLSMALAYQLNSLSHQRHGRAFLATLLGLAVLGFILLYPFLTGLALPADLASLFFFTNLTKNPF